MIEGKLLPCPFCGSEIWGVFGPDDRTGTYWIECSGDDCPFIFHAEVDSKDEVYAAWSRRAPRAKK